MPAESGSTGAQGGLRAPFLVPPGPGAQPPAGPNQTSSAGRLAKRPRSPGGSPRPPAPPPPGRSPLRGRASRGRGQNHFARSLRALSPLTLPGALRDTRPQKCQPRASGPQRRRRRAATDCRSRAAGHALSPARGRYLLGRYLLGR